MWTLRRAAPQCALPGLLASFAPLSRLLRSLGIDRPYEPRSSSSNNNWSPCDCGVLDALLFCGVSLPPSKPPFRHDDSSSRHSRLLQRPSADLGAGDQGGSALRFCRRLVTKVKRLLRRSVGRLIDVNLPFLALKRLPP